MVSVAASDAQVTVVSTLPNEMGMTGVKTTEDG